MKNISKVLVVILVVFLASNVNAQSKLKIGHVDSGELFKMMPGRDTAQAKLQTISKTLEDQLKAMQTEYDSKVASYQAEQATMSDLIKQTKGKEIQDLAKRIEDFQTSAQTELQTKESELVQPIIDKAKKAIEAVAKENGYTYIFDSAAGSVVLYAEPTDDIMSLVKKKLGIK